MLFVILYDYGIYLILNEKQCEQKATCFGVDMWVLSQKHITCNGINAKIYGKYVFKIQYFVFHQLRTVFIPFHLTPVRHWNWSNYFVYIYIRCSVSNINELKTFIIIFSNLISYLMHKILIASLSSCLFSACWWRFSLYIFISLFNVH